MSTAIPYLDEVWNVTTGCGDDMASPGCLNCYARRMTSRTLWGYDFAPTFHADRLDQPLHWLKPRRVGVSFMGDLFHEAITDWQIDSVFCVMEENPHHTYLLLTKRPERMREYVLDLQAIHEAVPRASRGYSFPWPHIWLGVTVCNQAEADRNIPILLATPAAKQWVSLEPMLSAVYGDHPRRVGYEWSWRDLDWVVLGGETGPGARPMDPVWALDVYRQCETAGVAFYWKQRGSAWERSTGWGRQETCDMQATHELPVVTP